VVEIAARAGVFRSTLHRRIGSYLAGNVAGLVDQSHRPAWCPHQASQQVEVLDLSRSPMPRGCWGGCCGGSTDGCGAPGWGWG
jgi:hypothetical protein